MANKRLSELNELSAANLKTGDLFYVVDTATNVLEGKKIEAGSIKTFVLDGVDTYVVSESLSSDTASYLLYTGVPNGTASNAISASYIISASYAERTFFSSLSDTASYLAYDGIRPNGTASYANYASSSLTSSYIVSSSYALSASYASSASLADSSKFLIYIGTSNGIASDAISSSYSVTASLSDSASYLIYDGTRPNGTASYANYASSSLTSSYIVSSSYTLSASYAKQSDTTLLANSASFLWWTGETTPNGTASYSWSGSHALISDSSSYLIYDGITPNGTSSYSLYSSASWSSSYAQSGSFSNNALNSVSASYALTSSYPGLDPNQYKIYGPFNTTDAIYGTQTSTELSYRNFIINPLESSTTTIIIQALCDVKVPITTTDTDSYTVDLIIEDWTGGSEVGEFILDTSRPNNYVNLSMTGAFTLSGYGRQPTVLMGSNTSIEIISGSWYTLRLKASNGTTFDSNALIRGATFYIYVKPDTALTRTAYPPF